MSDQTAGQGARGERAGKQERSVRAEFLPKLRRTLARVPFAEDLLAAYYAVLDRNTPTAVRATLVGALAYFIVPLDFVPDLLLGLGFTDDAAILFAALRMVAGAVKEEHREAARRWLRQQAQN